MASSVFIMNDTIYQTPEGKLSGETMPASRTGKILAIIGSIFLLAIPISVVTFVLKMVLIFEEITNSGNGDPQLLAGSISSALVPIVLGLVASLPGIFLLILSVSIFNYRRPWVFWVSLGTCLLCLLVFPIGTLLAIILLTLLLVKRRSFFVKYVHT